MPQCKHYETCGLDDGADTEAGLCILHSKNPEKDKQAFAAALDAHRKKNGNVFAFFVFPVEANFARSTFTGEVSFFEATFTKEAEFTEAIFTENAYFHKAAFTKEANFRFATFTKEAAFVGATFTHEANFAGANFTEGAYFQEATFTKEAYFLSATFTEPANFVGAMFTKEAHFVAATFAGRANFNGTTFTGPANFGGAMFSGGANFQDTSFKGESVYFNFSSFRGRTLFSSRREEGRIVPIFSGVKVDFRQALINPPDTVTFLEADLSKCRFQDTDLRRVQMTGVIWPKIGGRFGVYDEITPLQEGEVHPWARIERLYRELKQNYEDRRDYERAGDFHYGEKEMRRRNPDTPLLLRFLLTLYWLFSGYGERYLRPLLWAGLLLAASTIGYLWFGISPKGGGSKLALTNVSDWLKAVFYSFRVMTFLRPDDLIPIGYSKVVNTVESLLGPLFLGLFALAVRQRLKR